MRGKQGGSEGGEMMMACLLIIIVYMAQYCNYWRKRKSPIGGNIILGGGVEDIMDGVKVVPHPTQQSTICCNGSSICHEQ